LSILKIEPVKRDGIKLLMSFFGMSETGKTFSALRVAAGLEPNPAKRLLLDTEGGERGRLYHDAIPGGYLYAALSPPFSPARYVEALDEIAQAGVNVVVIDSISHVWAAEGGVLEMAELSPVKNDLGKWILPKRALRKLDNRIKSCGMHVILCARGKKPMITDSAGKMVPGPVVPVQEKNLRYDLTIIAHMLGDGRFSIAKEEGGKCPGPMRHIFAGTELMGEDTGRALIAWIGEQTLKTPAQKLLDQAASDAAEGGTKAYEAFFLALSKPDRAYLLPQHGNLKSIAAEADRQAQDRADQRDDDGKADPFPPTPSERLTIEPAGSSAAQTMLARIAAFELVVDLMSWWSSDEMGEALNALGIDDQAAVDEAYQARRAALAKAAGQ
jgi:AAA domain-containing protein